MADIIPPSPIDAPFGSYNWQDWYFKVRKAINDAATLQWSQITDFTGSNLTQLVTRNHNDLQSFQGGAPNDYYHLTNAQWTALTAGFTGTGNLVRQTTPTLTTPVIGAATGTSLALTGAITTGDGLNRLATTTDTTPTTVTAWDTRHTVFGPTTTTGTGFGVSVNKTTNICYGIAASPGVAWREFQFGVSKVTVNPTGSGVTITLDTNITTTGGITTGSTTLHTTTVALTNGAGAGAGTITNAPAAGNPTKWIPINDNGTTRYIPAW